MIKAILFDRDGTLIHDIPYNGDPARVRPIDGIAEALAELRRAGLLLGVVTNQSAIARGLITHAQADAVNTEVERHLGPFDTWQICPHQDTDHCHCRKPAPGLIIQAANALHVPPAQCLVIGDRSTDLDAAKTAGAAGILFSRWLSRMSARRPGRPVTPASIRSGPSPQHGEVDRCRVRIEHNMSMVYLKK